MSNAPVCNINPPSPSAEPTVPSIPAIPVATDLQSAIRAINTMRGIIQTMTNQIANNNSGARTTSFKSSGSTKKNSDFAELTAKRTTATKKIYQNNDPSTGVFVEVKQITGLTFLNPVTGQRISWKQGNS